MPQGLKDEQYAASTGGLPARSGRGGTGQWLILVACLAWEGFACLHAETLRQACSGHTGG